MNFVFKGNVDPNRSFTCAEEKTDLRCEDTLGGEQVLNSDLPKKCFNETNSECVLGQSIFSMFISLASNGPVVLGKTDDLMIVNVMFLTPWLMIVLQVRSLRIHSVKPLNYFSRKSRIS
ncbi:hypothetical protein Hanom_Chr13g01218001 [Helianthus anomalus]